MFKRRTSQKSFPATRISSNNPFLSLDPVDNEFLEEFEYSDPGSNNPFGYYGQQNIPEADFFPENSNPDKGHFYLPPKNTTGLKPNVSDPNLIGLPSVASIRPQSFVTDFADLKNNPFSNQFKAKMSMIMTRRKLPAIPLLSRNKTLNDLEFSQNLITFQRAHNKQQTDLTSGVLRKFSELSPINDELASNFNESLQDLNVFNDDPQIFSEPHSLIVKDHVIDIDYDSDIGYVSTNVRYTGHDQELRDKFKDRRRNLRKSSSLSRDKSISYIEESFDRSKIKSKNKQMIEGKTCSNQSTKIKDFKEKSFARNAEKDSDIFKKCSNKSSGSFGETTKQKSFSEEDEVFESKLVRGAKNSSFNGKPSKSQNCSSRRSSSLEALPVEFAKKLDHGSLSRTSSVSINDTPEYFDYPPCPSSTSPNANHFSSPSTFANNNGIALLGTKPARGSLKKPPHSKNTNKSGKSPKKSPHSSKLSLTITSDYEVRDRGRSRHPDHRESFKKNARAGEQDRESSDRELLQKDAILNRSLSNNDGALEDRIGKLLTINSIYIGF